MLTLWKRLGRCALFGTALLATTHWAMGQTAPIQSPPAPIPAPAARADDNAARLDRLEKQNQELLKLLKTVQDQQQTPAAPPSAPTSAPVAVEGSATGGVNKDDVQKIVSDYLAEKTQRKQQMDADVALQQQQTGFTVGGFSAVPFTGSLQNGFFPWFYSPNKDFSMHLGMFVQWDNVWWDQTQALGKPQGGRSTSATSKVASGANQGGINTLEDGEAFRRIRPFWEGTFYEHGEYRLFLNLENDQMTTVGLNEFWVGAKDIPLIGTVRVGHIRNAMGLEANMTASTMAQTFMEMSSYAESIEMNQYLVSGIQFQNYWLPNERGAATFNVFRLDNAQNTGAFYGTGQFGWQGRLTGLVWYENDGRDLLHLGWSGGWRNGTNNINGVNAATASNLSTFTLQARPELRDDTAAGSPAGASQLVPNSNSNRMVSTGAIVARDQYLSGLELFWIRGAFSLQAEYGVNILDGATGFAPNGLNTTATTLAHSQNYMFHGGYVQLAYTLTGENRGYEKRFGGISRRYFGASGPYNNAWIVRDESGHCCWNIGAWEIAARYSYTNLNDGLGASRVQGGVMDGLSLGLNWYLNSNVNVMFDYVYDNRFDLPTGSIPGATDGFGIRVQWQF